MAKWLKLKVPQTINFTCFPGSILGDSFPSGAQPASATGNPTLLRRPGTAERCALGKHPACCSNQLFHSVHPGPVFQSCPWTLHRVGCSFISLGFWFFFSFSSSVSQDTRGTNFKGWPFILAMAAVHIGSHIACLPETCSRFQPPFPSPLRAQHTLLLSIYTDAY